MLDAEARSQTDTVDSLRWASCRSPTSEGLEQQPPWAMEYTTVEDFFNSKSMLTPGVAGLTTTMITGTLANIFELPGAMTGLVVSFVVGLLVWFDTNTVWQKRLLLYVINSFVIFTVATGINQAGVAATREPAKSGYQSRGLSTETGDDKTKEGDRPFFQPWF